MSQNMIPCYNPCTLEKLGEVKVHTTEDVNRIVASARAAQKQFGKTKFSDRKKVLRKLLDMTMEKQDEIVKLSVMDTGKTLIEAQMGEVLTTCEKLRHTMKYGEKYLKTEYRTVPALLFLKSARVEYSPLGVIGIIIPWNYPFHNILSAITSALAAGNAAVVKVSEFASYSSQKFEKMIQDAIESAGYPRELVQMVYGYGETGSALVRSGVDKILFIGSPQVGKLVMKGAADNLTPVILELGGKDPFIVFNDCDYENTVHCALRGVFTNCGQNCIAAERIYVQAGIFDKFAGRVSEMVRNFRQGNPLECEADIGAITMQRQLEIVEELVEDAVKNGAKVLAGGKRSSKKGQFFQPTVLEVKQNMRIVNEEAFGPVMLLVKFETEEEVIEMANGTPYALSSCIMTKDYRKAERVAKQLVTGMTVINDFGIPYMIQACPFGGLKVSGFGKFNGPEGLQAFSSQKTVVTDRFHIVTAVPRFTQYPMLPYAHKIAQDAVAAIYTQSWAKCITGFARLLGRLAGWKKD